MKKYYLGELHSRKGEKDKIYYDGLKKKFHAIKQNGEERKLTWRQKKYLYQKFYIKCIAYQKISRLKIGIPAAAMSAFILYVCKYNNILEDLPQLEKEYCFNEKILHEERDIDFLIEMCEKSIDKNDQFTEEQKEYLKSVWSEYLMDEGTIFKRKVILETLNGLASVNVEYKPYENNHIYGRYYVLLNNIILYFPNDTRISYDEALFHETLHCSLRYRLNGFFHDLEEGYCGAVERKYCVDGSYRNENEYLLLISEIIGKENVKQYLINGDERRLINELAEKTNTSKEEIEELIRKTLEYNSISLNDQEEIENLSKEIKQELAELAIKADEKNKENFIVLNAYYDKYYLSSSFLEDEYIDGYFYDYNEFDSYFAEGLVARIDESNKYDYAYLFEDELTLTKSKTNK